MILFLPPPSGLASTSVRPQKTLRGEIHVLDGVRNRREDRRLFRNVGNENIRRFLGNQTHRKHDKYNRAHSPYLHKYTKTAKDKYWDHFSFWNVAELPLLSHTLKRHTHRLMSVTNTNTQYTCTIEFTPLRLLWGTPKSSVHWSHYRMITNLASTHFKTFSYFLLFVKPKTGARDVYSVHDDPDVPSRKSLKFEQQFSFSPIWHFSSLPFSYLTLASSPNQ